MHACKFHVYIDIACMHACKIHVNTKDHGCKHLVINKLFSSSLKYKPRPCA